MRLEWTCQFCGGKETWFDRTITCRSDGTEEGMKTRCVKCGRATGDLPNAAGQGRREATYPEPAGSASLVAQPPRDVSELYHELLYAVARKFPGESRHETALRYIRDTEERACEG